MTTPHEVHRWLRAAAPSSIIIGGHAAARSGGGGGGTSPRASGLPVQRFWKLCVSCVIFDERNAIIFDDDDELIKPRLRASS